MPETSDSHYHASLAVYQDAAVELVFLLDRCPYSKATGICTGLKDDLLTIRLPVDQNTRVIWGSDVDVSFSVRDIEIVPCSFRSRIVGLRTGAENLLYLAIPLPRTMIHDPLRKSFRARFPMLANASIFHSSIGGRLRLPDIVWTQLDASNVADISASGMRLDFDVERLVFVDDLVFLELPDMGVLGSVVRLHPNCGIMSAGCRFRKWRDAQGRWFLAGEGIGKLARYIRAFQKPFVGNSVKSSPAFA